MIRLNRAGIIAAVSSAVALLALLPAGAQEISESHLKAARAAITAIHATDQLDLVLPSAADTLKKQLIQNDPNLQDVIVKVVDEQTLAIVARRADVEKEAALAYARAFTEAELNEIAAFYQTDAGKKLIVTGPVVMDEVMKAGQIWQRGVSRDLAQAVSDGLRKELPATKPQPKVDAAAPASDDDQPAQ